MNDSSSDIPDEENKSSSDNDSQKILEDTPLETLSDGIFTIKISEDMALRNALRSGLVEAQGSDTEKIPMYVSWPHWLEDGIVCLFSRDLHHLLNKTVQDAVISFEKTFEIGVESSASDTIIEEKDGETEALPRLENDMEKVESEIETSIEAEQQVDQETEPDKKQETSAEISEIESEGTKE